jgi:hypothetical protein
MIVSIFRAEGRSVPSENNIVGDHWAQFRVRAVAQQSFHVTPCVASDLKGCYFLLYQWHSLRSGQRAALKLIILL